MTIASRRLLGLPAKALLKRNLSTAAPAAELSKTPLYDLHVQHAAKMAPFAGYSMPLYYAKGGAEEHKHVRTHAGLFDVSHMVQSMYVIDLLLDMSTSERPRLAVLTLGNVFRITGNGATAFLDWLTPTRIGSLPFDDNMYNGTLTVLLNGQGGILDDLIVTRQGHEKWVTAPCSMLQNTWENSQAYHSCGSALIGTTWSPTLPDALKTSSGSLSSSKTSTEPTMPASTCASLTTRRLLLFRDPWLPPLCSSWCREPTCPSSTLASRAMQMWLTCPVTFLVRDTPVKMASR